MARLESFFLQGPAGRLECLLKHPRTGRAAGGPGGGGGDAPGGGGGAAAVVCHPHPLFGGTLHNKVVHAAAEALSGFGLPVLRFNFRGAGRSAGAHDAGVGEQDDLRAVLDHLEGRFPGRPLLLCGYSFGAYVALLLGCRDPRAAALIGIGAPLTMVSFGFLKECRKPLALIQGEKDPFAPLGLLMTLAAMLPGGASVRVVPGAGHGFEGRLDELAARVADAVPDDLRAPS
jgi:hypothetical protein